MPTARWHQGADFAHEVPPNQRYSRSSVAASSAPGSVVWLTELVPPMAAVSTVRAQRSGGARGADGERASDPGLSRPSVGGVVSVRSAE
jgi:hypothetical protein